MKSLILASLVLSVLASPALAADSCATSPDETYAQILKKQKVDIGDLSDMETDLKMLGQKIDAPVSAEEKTWLRKLAARDRLAIELQVNAARAALSSIKGMKGEEAYAKYVGVVTTATAFYGKIFEVSEKYFAGRATAAEVKAVMENLVKNAQTFAAQSQGVKEELQSVDTNALFQLAQKHTQASQIQRCQIARKTFVR